MAVNPDNAREPFSPRPSIAALLQGLVQDFKQLLAAELRLAQDEIRSELAKARAAAIGTAFGLALAAIGGLLLLLMLVHLLHDVAGLPLWSAYGLVGGVLVTGGGALLWRARSAAADIHLLPRNTAQTVKENLAWLKQQATSPRI